MREEGRKSVLSHSVPDMDIKLKGTEIYTRVMVRRQGQGGNPG